MKYLLIIFSLLLFACKSTDEETLMFLNEGMERCNEQLEIINDGYYVEIIAASKENPVKVKEILDNADSLMLYSERVGNIVDSIKKELLINMTLVKQRNLFSI
jgi:hypothetical protein